MEARGVVEEKGEGVGLVNPSMASLAREKPEIPTIIGGESDAPIKSRDLRRREPTLVSNQGRRFMVLWERLAVVVVIVLAVVWAFFLR